MKIRSVRSGKIKKITICTLLVAFLSTVCVSTTLADDNAIIVTGEMSVAPVKIETEQPTVDIPIVAEALDDVYAFEISMTYAPGVIIVESISIGDVFSDYGSAVIINDIDNDAGRVKFMQTILSADKGTDDGGVLCVIRITFEDGTYNAVDDLGLAVKLANSTPEYIAAYTTPCTITVDTQANSGTQPAPTTESTPTQSPAPTATIGVVMPDPQSEQADDFVVAEDESTDAIIEAAAEFDSQSISTEGEAVAEIATEADIEPTEPSVMPPDDAPYWIFWVGAAAVVVAVAAWLLIRRKRRKRTRK